MFWHDIAEIKERLTLLEDKIDTAYDKDQYWDEKINDSLDEIHDSLKEIYKSHQAVDDYAKMQKIADKFDDYMKNLDKLNSLVNEFKGCVSMARASLNETKPKTRKPRKKNHPVSQDQ